MTERMYAPTGTVAHLVARNMYGVRVATCGLVLGDWGRGTGSQDEYEKAAALPTCRRCEKLSAPNPSGLVWVCRRCGHESPHAYGVLEHRQQTGHLGSSPRFAGREGASS